MDVCGGRRAWVCVRCAGHEQANQSSYDELAGCSHQVHNNHTAAYLQYCSNDFICSASESRTAAAPSNRFGHFSNPSPSLCINSTAQSNTLMMGLAWAVIVQSYSHNITVNYLDDGGDVEFLRRVWKKSSGKYRYILRRVLRCSCTLYIAFGAVSLSDMTYFRVFK